MNILSIYEIVELLREQAKMRSLENDEAGLLQFAADSLELDYKSLID